MNNFKSIADILAIDDTVIRTVECPEWGCTFYVRTVSANKKDEFDSRFTRDSDGNLDLIGYRAHMVAMCACDPDGKFLNPTPSEIKALGQKNAIVLDRIFGVCQELTSDTPNEDLEKNLQLSAAASDSG